MADFCPKQFFIILIMLSSNQQQKAIHALLRKKENEFCADCNSKNPCWASLDFGVFICMNCAGAHRALGQSVTRVKSTKLDTWHRDWLENMRIGNSILNQYWEKQLNRTACSSKPNANTSLQEIIEYVQKKYVQRRFADQKQAHDPLKRPKMKDHDQYQKIQAQNKCQQSKISKKETQSTHKVAAHSPFEAFDSIIAKKLNTQKKTSQNLISFDFQQKKCAQNQRLTKLRQNLAPQMQVMKNHNQFQTFSGTTKVENDLFANFDSFIKSKDNHNACLNNKDNVQIKPIGNRAQHISKAHTTNVINKNPYSTMNHMNAHNTPFHANNANHDHLLKNHSNMMGVANQFLANNHPLLRKHACDNINITLDSNIDLATSGKKHKEVKSWVDQWK